MINSQRKGSRSLGVLILAAGQGTRMESSIPKVLHRVGGKPMIFYILRIANALKPAAIGIVVGHEAEKVKAEVGELVKECGISRPVQFILQKDARGSGNAVLAAVPFLKKFKTAVVLCGDTPLLTFESLYGLTFSHEEQKGQATLLTAKLANPKGYGRIVRSPMGEVLRIVEDAVATPKELALNEVNSGAYCFEVETLLMGLKEIGSKGPKGEQFLTDIMELVRCKGGKINAYLSSNPEEILGVNSRVQLANAERVINRRMLERLMLSGVTVCDPASTHVDADVEIGQDSVVEPFTILRGKTKIGKLCRIGPFCCMENVQVGNECDVRVSQLKDCRLLEKCVIGPFSNIRPDSVLGPRAKVGNFSEVKASRIGFGSKVPHLSYIGDTDIMEDVNVGAGTITCNFDGKAKHKTTIGAKAFIGSNVNLVAPVKVGRGARIGAGSTITDDVPDAALAIARARQVNKI
ncbi:MAG TPA: UDP-N-acetylglucosamine diphosphorylase/glucosamine-1-phosphate N-acetyltransferase [Elusimicrobia bacterium]|nr:UDP-N-acetylglucosamine diphosphorylase/glucosamine-1-phosphate N-acetyltransferase [Elusimicrobiota bacterium]HBT61004.1 UDP-N-acetylglucosamine diphosphorylase/glucosamine-1-phosphate N-acetyltransferase [Elusimicrobiota bacterium]